MNRDKDGENSQTESSIIESIVKDLYKYSATDYTTRWPYILEDSFNGADPGSGGDLAAESLPPVSFWNFNDQPQTDVQINFVPLHPWCNTLCLEVNPWCLIVNQLGVDLFVKATKEDGSGGDSKSVSKEMALADNSVLVPSQLDSFFQLGIYLSETEKFYTPALQLSDQEWRFRNRLMPQVTGFIPKEGVIHTKIPLREGKSLFMTIQSRNENGMRIIRILPSFSVTNATGSILVVAPLLSDSTHSSDSSKKVKLGNFPSTSQEDITPDSDQATPLLFWDDVDKKKSSSTFEGFPFLAFRIPGETHWSLPVSFEDCRHLENEERRSAFMAFEDVHSDPQNCALLVTAHQIGGRVFFVVNSNKKPAIRIYNNLDISLAYGEVLPNRQGIEHSYSVFVEPTSNVVRPRKSSWFQLPWIDANFPFRDSPAEWPRVALSKGQPDATAGNAYHTLTI